MVRTTPRRMPVDLSLEDQENTFPTDVPVIVEGSIATFASDFVGGFDAPEGSLSSLPQEVRTDVEFLRSWELPDKVYYGSGDYPLLPFTSVCAVPHRAIPTAAQVVSDLHKPDFAANAPGVQLESTNPPWVRNAWDQEGVDEIHTDEAKQHLFCTVEDMEGEINSYMVFPGTTAASMRAEMRQNNGALQALRAYVLGGHLFFVLLHTPKVPLGGGHAFSTWALQWAVGVSPSSGNLVGAFGRQRCHNLCD